ncbi:type III-B CRISPR module RAMP protein Cmr6 [Pseudoalteromonas rhizosphaerae]|uniref:type III-B CRISPR module RAMP protein Cmr6 n=1 Tax=Pseudoalteromonas rhizosphaerae TaxID=2518973 RepID=UPI00384E7C0C
MIELRRTAIDRLSPQKSESINPSLWLQKGLKRKEEDKDKLPKDEDKPKTKHLKELVDFKCELYPKAFNRWVDLTSDENRFSQSVMTLENRLLIGLTGNGALETGCSLSHNYGMPYIPGSSVKGVVRAWATKYLPNSNAALEALFGTYDSEQTNRVAASVTFHDAWWIPDPEKKEHKSFVLDVVTTHHQGYYNGKEDLPSDKDSPIPNHMLAVQGSFLFAIEGDPKSIKLCQELLQKALAGNGIGAKTAAGYGYMKRDTKLESTLKIEAEKRLPPEIREKRQAEAQRRTEQEREATAKAELAKPPAQIIGELKSDYLKNRDHAEYQLKVENWINTAIENWTIEDRELLVSCLKEVSYVPNNKKNPNHQIRKQRLQQLRGE